MVFRRRLSGLDEASGGSPLKRSGPAAAGHCAGRGAGSHPGAHHALAVLEVLREDFVRTARAKGLSQRAALWGHVLRNAMIPVVTVMGLQFASCWPAPSWWRTCSTCRAWAG
jgi:hypothetical protein